jgi:hypothetical protein
MNHLIKALIATFAVLSAALVPRLVAAITTSDPTGEIELFGRDYVVLSVVLSVFVGVGVMITLWGATVEPSKIFAHALAYPAIVSGGLNLTASVDDLQAKNKETRTLAEALRQTRNIKVLPPLSIKPTGSLSSPPAARRTTMARPFRLVSVAHAAEAETSSKGGFNPGVVLREPTYYIVVFSADTESKAREWLKANQQAVPNGQVVKASNGRYLVLASFKPLPAGEASIKAWGIAKQLSPKVAAETSIGLMPSTGQRQ